jgi:hypothetical protein
MKKFCQTCSIEFLKNPTHSRKYWATKKFCSIKCSKLNTKRSLVAKQKTSKSLKSFYSIAENREMLRNIKIKQWAQGFLGATGKNWTKTPEQLANKMGCKNPAWKGGITPINLKIRNSTKYANWRNEVFKRDEYICQDCGTVGGELNADHIKPFAFFPESRFDVSNGRTLCVTCHRSTPTYGGRCRDTLLTITL